MNMHAEILTSYVSIRTFIKIIVSHDQVVCTVIVCGMFLCDWWEEVCSYHHLSIYEKGNKKLFRATEMT